MCVLNLIFWLDAKSSRGLQDLTSTKKTGTAKHRLEAGPGGGDNICGRGTISASGLCPWGTISASRLCPGTKSAGGTESAPTTARSQKMDCCPRSTCKQQCTHMKTIV